MARQKTANAEEGDAPLRIKEINAPTPATGTPVGVEKRRTATRIRISRRRVPEVELASRTPETETEPQDETTIQAATGEAGEGTNRVDHPAGEETAQEPIRATRARSREERGKRIWLPR